MTITEQLNASGCIGQSEYDKPCTTPQELRHHTPGTYSVHYMSVYPAQVMERRPYPETEALALLQQDMVEYEAQVDPAALSGEVCDVCVYEIMQDRTCILRDRAMARHR
jgi:hypothetical protein